MIAVVLAGGRGSRLQPLTDKLPKALVPVGGHPIIEILLSQLRKGGVSKVYLSIGHLGDQIRACLGDGQRLGLELVYVPETEPLSTVGPLRLIDDLPDQFLVANGDILTDLNLQLLIQSHRESKAELTVAATERMDKMDFGLLELEGQRIVGFKEKPRQKITVSMGIYLFSKSLLDLIPKEGPFGFDELMIKMLDESRAVRAFVHDGYWLDIGRPTDYLRANQDSEKLAKLFDL